MFPENINKYVKNLTYTIDNIGRSEDKVYIFENQLFCNKNCIKTLYKKKKSMYN